MSTLTITLSHTLSTDEVASRIQRLLGDLKARHGDKINDLNEEWSGNTGTFRCFVMGLRVSGTLAIEPTQVTITGELPLAALPFKGQLESMIKQRASELLA